MTSNKQQTLNGYCHCRTVHFQVLVDLTKPLETIKCNCTICAKSRWWEFYVHPEEFTLISGEDQLGLYQFGDLQTSHYFCKRCGVKPYIKGTSGNWGGKFVGINVNCIDEFTQEQLESFTPNISYLNGISNDWNHCPKHFKYL
ncbi:hypothetical protein CYY_005168 [Polysphondylium violaceum]|uniref:CENP-V/GFA domain-containing protein n=1 Tax=Polysphondylium violaceum TaxID=133409 RepID=A0A8J4PS61_9MYCE|nr:hypothetical protein CYY_005168 [Polysphondylium violaceum]